LVRSNQASAHRSNVVYAMTQHQFVCPDCGQVLVCLRCNPQKKRPLNAQAQAVKDCLDSYVAAREAIKLPYPGVPPVGRLVQWLGDQPDRDKAVSMFKECVSFAEQAHKLDYVYHPMPRTVPKFIEAMPKLDRSWLDGARRSAAERRGEIPSAPVAPFTSTQQIDREAERRRIALQTDCAAELRFGQRGADECGTKPECCGCPQRENPGSGRYRPAGRQERQDGGLKRTNFKIPNQTKELHA